MVESASRLSCNNTIARESLSQVVSGIWIGGKDQDTSKTVAENLGLCSRAVIFSRVS